MRISTNCWLGSAATLVATSSITETRKPACAGGPGATARAAARAAARMLGRNGPTLRHRDDADAARLGRAADVVAERHDRTLHLPPLGLALELLVVLVDH